MYIHLLVAEQLSHVFLPLVTLSFSCQSASGQFSRIAVVQFIVAKECVGLIDLNSYRDKSRI